MNRAILCMGTRLLQDKLNLSIIGYWTQILGQIHAEHYLRQISTSLLTNVFLNNHVKQYVGPVVRCLTDVNAFFEHVSQSFCVQNYANDDRQHIQRFLGN